MKEKKTETFFVIENTKSCIHEVTVDKAGLMV